jgi:hypothetical protein
MIYSDVDLGLMGKVLFVYAVDDKGIEYALYLGATLMISSNISSQFLITWLIHSH